VGKLSKFNIADLKLKYDLTAFVETGTWKGDAVEFARTLGFGNIYSIELHTDFWEKACQKFAAFPYIKILQGTSIDNISSILSLILPNKTLWWLDAHLHDTYGLDKAMTDRFPLEKELQLISRSRDISGDVFIIDDLRIYEDGNFACGLCPKAHQNPVRGIDFVFTSLGKTHTIMRRYEDEGYIVCLPKENTK